MNELDAAAEGMPTFLRLSNFSHAQLCRYHFAASSISFENDGILPSPSEPTFKR